MSQLIINFKKQNKFLLKSEGNSMYPLLQSNDVLYFKKTTFLKIKINDLVMAEKNKNLFTHRVIYKDDTHLVTKGDNNPQSDGKVYPKQIIGKVYQVKRNGQTFDPESLYLLQSTLYFQEIVKVKKLLEREGIDFVFLKGLPLHLYYEKTHPRRMYLDCDVLIKSGDFLKAEKILFQSGYQKAKTELSSSHKKMKDKEVENAYFKVINSIHVVFDLHLEVVFMMTQLGKLNALYPQKLINQMTHEFLKNKLTVKIQNESFFILDSSFLTLYLALHFFHHNFQGTFRLEFLDKVIRKEKLSEVFDDLPAGRQVRITETIQKYRLQNFVYPVFVLLKKLYNTPIPLQFIKSIQPSPSVLCYLSSIINHPSSVFDDEPRVKAGINRFKNLFYLSPEPLWKKIFIFVNPQVVYSIFWVLQRKLFSFFSNRK